MADLWLPGAQRLSSSHSGESMLGGPARAVWHRTSGGTYESNASYLKQEGYEPHLLWDPTTGQIGQFIAANLSGYALEHPSGTPQTNREGTYCIQIEVADHGQTWDITSTKMLGWDKIRPWLKSLGIPEVWPQGAPPALGSRNEAPASVWLNKSGHYSHSQVPNNHHTDPGHMDLAVLFKASAPAPAPQPAVKRTPDGDRWLGLYNPPLTGSDVAGVRHALHLCDPSFPEGDVYDLATSDEIAIFQQHRGINERGVGPETWKALRAVPGVH